MSRFVSTCNQFPEAECNPPVCEYVKGQTRKSYCRISQRYIMNKKNFTISRRIKKKDLENVSKQRIGNFIKKSKNFLNIVCPNSGICTAFGNHTKELNAFFKGFTDFQYVKTPIKKIGEVSVNGFVKEIEYEKEGYKAYAILKCSQKPGADNLVYEYIVGLKYVNRIIKSFPCFVETYGLYYFDKDSNWTIMKTPGPIHHAYLGYLLLQKNIDYVKACQESKFAAILIQHVENAKAFETMMKNTTFVKNDMLYALFIVYHALALNSKTFTHYDLHMGNVLLYEPVPGKFIEYHYHNIYGTVTSFFSPYIPKIIDYGRSFFDNGNVSSNKIYRKICSVKECDPDCGSKVGMAWLDPEPYLTISSSKKNESHDLRLLYLVRRKIETMNVPTEKTFTETKKVLRKVVYGISLTVENIEYGTKENLTMPPNKIYNVNSAYQALKQVVYNPDVVKENRRNYSNMANKIGILHVYFDKRPMKYEPMK